jgi:hypothetical protein
LADVVHNEQTKYSAAALDRISTACIAIGAIAPIVAVTVGTPGYAPGWGLIGFSVVWLLVGAVLHFLGRAMLRSLKP